MADQSQIDRIATRISSQIDQLQKEVVIQVLEAMQKTQRLGTGATLIEILDKFNFKEIVTAKAQNIIATFGSAHIQVLKDTFSIAKVSEETLLALKNFSQSTFLEQIGSLASTIKEEIARGSLAGFSRQQIIESIRETSGLTPAHIRTNVTTALNNYSRSVTKVMMDAAPKNTKYEYIGPIDDRTRDECLEMGSAGSLTLEQIRSQFGEAVLVDGGGINCRHKWEIASQEKFFHDVRTAKAQADA